MTKWPDNGKKQKIDFSTDEQVSDPRLNISRIVGYQFVAGLEDANTINNEEIETGNEEIGVGPESYLEKQALNHPFVVMDRISPLPDPILQRILCYLSTKQAFQSCTLSKSWRYICSTRPKFEVRESFFNGNQEAFFSFLETTLSRYRDRNISLPEFLLEISSKLYSEFVPLLQTWIPVVLLGGMGVKKFSLNFISDYLVNCDFLLAPTVFKAESLEELHLTGCDLSRINHTNEVMFNNLRTLSLSRVWVSEVTLERIISSCPLIEHVAINRCTGLGDIKVNNNGLKLLKRFDFVAVRKNCSDCDGYTIEIDVPNIECIRISNRIHWSHFADYLSFTRLKSLYLRFVVLSEVSFHRFSVDFCCLEELTLIDCWGFDEFKLASCSIKNLSLYVRGLRKAAIDVPNIRCFELSCVSLPSISFTTSASSEWKSKVIVETFDSHHLIVSGPSSILLDIYRLHKAALCHSEFSLHVTSPFGFLPRNGVGSPVVIENLTMDANICLFPLGAWLGRLFCFFRPRNIEHFWYVNPQNDSDGVNSLLVNCLREFLVEDNLKDLEQVLEEEESSSNEHGEEAEYGLLLDNRKQKIRFRLKWRESRSFA